MQRAQHSQDVASFGELAARLCKDSGQLSAEEWGTISAAVQAIQSQMTAGSEYQSRAKAISEQERVLAESRYSKALLDAIFEADPSGLAVVSGPELRYVYANPVYRYLCLGCSPIGQPYADFSATDGQEKFVAEIKQVLANGKPFQSLGYEWIFPDGGRRTFTFQTRRIDWDGEPAALITLWDTTDLGRSEALLKRYRLLFEHARDTILFVRLSDGAILEANRAAEQAYGYSREELLRMKIGNLRADKTQTQIASQMSAANTEGILFETVHRRKDGSTFPVEVSSLGADFEGQRVNLSIIRDITERKLVEAALRQSEERAQAHAAELETVMNTTPAFVWVSHDPECRQMISNRYGYNFLNMRPGDNVSMSVAESELPAHYKVYRNGREIPASEMPMQIAARTGLAQQDYEFDVVFDGGETYHLYGNAVPLLDGDGHPSGAVGVFIDITQLKRAEQAVRISEESYRKLVELSPDAIYIQSGGRFVFVNQATLRLFGAERTDQLLGEPIVERVSPENRALVMERIRRVNEENAEVPPVELAYLKLDGTRIDVDIVATPFQHQNKPGALVIARDITLRHQLEAHHREDDARIEVQRRLLEQREQERLQIARNLHDGPLQDLIAATYTLHALSEKCIDATVLEEIKGVRASLQAQIEDLRTFAMELRPPVLTRQGLESTIRSHLEGFGKKHPELKVSFEASQSGISLPDTVRVALYRIYQETLNNILRHARASEVSIRLVKTSTQAVLEIQDNGQGFLVPEDWLSLARQNHLGLVGIRERVEALNGQVEIRSAPGQGALLKATIPLPPDHSAIL